MSARARAALAAILLLALGLRLAGIGFGLDLSDPRETVLNNLLDERGMVDDVQERFLRGSLHPGNSFLWRGPGGFLVFGAVDAALISARAVGVPGGRAGVVAGLERNPSLLHLAHRWVSAIAGVLGVLLVARIGAREFGQASGLCAALVLGTSYLHVRESHFGQVDTLWGLATLAALDSAFLLLRDPRPRRYALAGLLIGLAAAVKYFSALLAAHVGVAHALARGRAVRAGEAPPPHARLLLAWLLVPLGFLLAFPGLVPAWGDFVRHLADSGEKYGAAPSLSVALEGLLFHARYSLAIGLGETAFALALAGLWLAWRRGPGGRLLVLSILLFVPSVLLTEHRPVRFALGLLVLLALPAGIACASLLARVTRLARVPLLLLVAAPSLARSVAFDRLLPRRDTRLDMLALLREKDVPPEEVLGAGWHHGLPVPANRNALPYTWHVPQGREKIDKAALTASILADPPRLILRDYSAPESWVPPAIDELIRARYRELARFDGRRAGDPVELPDPLHGNPTHMIPYARPWAMERPGPPLALFERADP